ncbi:hypothetical protein EC915_11370 [Pseudomonas sp. LP_7_YM]|nr:hypothetical protein EC915_11370 [Pseudomonas sp. LP_7_YM]
MRPVPENLPDDPYFSNKCCLRAMARAREQEVKGAYVTHIVDLKEQIKPITGYTTFDLMGTQGVGFGSLSLGIQNLLHKQYSTVWG